MTAFCLPERRLSNMRRIFSRLHARLVQWGRKDWFRLQWLARHSSRGDSWQFSMPHVVEAASLQ